VAIDAAHYLLREGWVELTEKRQGSIWTITAVHWMDADALRFALGLPRRDAKIEARAHALAKRPSDSRFYRLHDSLSSLSIGTLSRRARIIEKLGEWAAVERSGSRNTFSQMALDDTHAMTSADWHWLEKYIDLESIGIYRHTPAVWLAGPLCLISNSGQLDIGAVPDMIALTPQTIFAIERIQSTAKAWLLVENRTSFEDVARRLGSEWIVVWMPGYVPDWWLAAIGHIQSLFTRHAFIAADPDPAGIEIASRAGQIWGADWIPWAMSPEALNATGRGKLLSEQDYVKLAAMDYTVLHPTLASLAAALSERGRKGEQEALDLPLFLPQ